MLKNFVAAFFAATLFTNSVAHAETDAPFSEENYEELPGEYQNEPELPGEYKEVLEPPHDYNYTPKYKKGKKTPDSSENPPETLEKPTEVTKNPSQVEGEGLEFLVYHKNGVMAFAIIADHEKYNLQPILAKNQIHGRATVSQMTRNFEDIAMINAGYFMPNGSLIGVAKINGEIIGKDDFYRSAIGIYEDGTAIFGRVRYQGEIEYYGNTCPIYNLNWERTENSLVLYNSYFGATTGTNSFGVEVVVEDGIITEIFHDKGNHAIPAGGYVISANGTAAEFFKAAQVGDAINIHQEIFSEDGNFNEVPTVIGAGPRLVMDGKIFVTVDAEEFPKDIRIGRAPRSAVGVNEYGDYIFAVVDGRQAHSKGCTLQEWAEILLNEFGAFQAINLDGGGSTELIVKDQLVNKPSDGKERPVGSFLAIVPK